MYLSFDVCCLCPRLHTLSCVCVGGDYLRWTFCVNFKYTFLLTRVAAVYIVH